MRLGSVLSEAMRNIAAGTSRAFLLFLAVLLSGGLLGGYEAMTVMALEQEAATRIHADADVKSVVGGSVDGVTCDRLTEVDGGPSASGAMRAGPQIVPKSTPGRDIASYEVTSGMLALVIAGEGDPTLAADAGGVWMSSVMADDFGLTVGSRFETEQGTSTVAGVFDWPNDGRDTRFAYAVLAPVSADDGRTFEECWAKQWPVSDETDGLLYSTVIITEQGAQSTSVGVTQVNKGFDSRYDATGGYLARMTRWMPLIALAVGLLLGAVSVRRRRLEYAGALHSGQGKGAQLFGIAVETVLWSGLATAASCSLLAAVCVRLAASDPLMVLGTAIRTPLALFAGTVCAALASGLLIRESQLFRYFKNR